jgi:hypothetical protein
VDHRAVADPVEDGRDPQLVAELALLGQELSAQNVALFEVSHTIRIVATKSSASARWRPA